MTTVCEIECRDCGAKVAVEIDEDVLRFESGMELIRSGTRCETCAAKVAERIEAERRAEAERRWLSTLQERFERSRLPREMIESFDADKANMDLLSWIETLGRISGLYIPGPTGCGKTRAVVQAGWRTLRNSDVELRYWRVSELMRELGALYGESGGLRKADRLIKELSAVSVLILDDLGKEGLTERCGEWLWEIIDSRYMRRLPTWITTNMSGSKIEDRLGDDRGPAIVRRLREMCEVWTEKKS